MRNPIIGLTAALTVVVGLILIQSSVEAVQRPPRPEPAMLSLIRVFGCDLNLHATGCAKNIEDQANDWLQKAQPGVRVLNQQMTASRSRLFLSLMYEVTDWRGKQEKVPAEAPPSR
jgi:hypothetical protein